MHFSFQNTSGAIRILSATKSLTNLSDEVCAVQVERLLFLKRIMLANCLRFVESFSSVLAYKFAALLLHENVILLKAVS